MNMADQSAEFTQVLLLCNQDESSPSRQAFKLRLPSLLKLKDITRQSSDTDYQIRRVLTDVVRKLLISNYTEDSSLRRFLSEQFGISGSDASPDPQSGHLSLILALPLVAESIRLKKLSSDSPIHTHDFSFTERLSSEDIRIEDEKSNLCDAFSDLSHLFVSRVTIAATLTRDAFLTLRFPNPFALQIRSRIARSFRAVLDPSVQQRYSLRICGDEEKTDKPPMPIVFGLNTSLLSSQRRIHVCEMLMRTLVDSTFELSERSMINTLRWLCDHVFDNGEELSTKEHSKGFLVPSVIDEESQSASGSARMPWLVEFTLLYLSEKQHSLQTSVSEMIEWDFSHIEDPPRELFTVQCRSKKNHIVSYLSSELVTRLHPSLQSSIDTVLECIRSVSESPSSSDQRAWLSRVDQEASPDVLRGLVQLISSLVLVEFLFHDCFPLHSSDDRVGWQVCSELSRVAEGLADMEGLDPIVECALETAPFVGRLILDWFHRVCGISELAETPLFSELECQECSEWLPSDETSLTKDQSKLYECVSQNWSLLESVFELRGLNVGISTQNETAKEVVISAVCDCFSMAVSQPSTKKRSRHHCSTLENVCSVIICVCSKAESIVFQLKDLDFSVPQSMPEEDYAQDSPAPRRSRPMPVIQGVPQALGGDVPSMPAVLTDLVQSSPLAYLIEVLQPHPVLVPQLYSLMQKYDYCGGLNNPRCILEFRRLGFPLVRTTLCPSFSQFGRCRMNQWCVGVHWSGPPPRLGPEQTPSPVALSPQTQSIPPIPFSADHSAPSEPPLRINVECEERSRHARLDSDDCKTLNTSDNRARQSEPEECGSSKSECSEHRSWEELSLLERSERVLESIMETRNPIKMADLRKELIYRLKGKLPDPRVFESEVFGRKLGLRMARVSIPGERHHQFFVFKQNHD